jgi:hypothetical protein
MNFLNRFFRKPNNDTQCPRCLGKGHVDAQDIRRLGQELKWMPGTCAYCNGKGSVAADMVEKIAADTAYLTTDISERERQKLIDGNHEAIERGLARDRFYDGFIQEIVYRHFTAGMDEGSLADFLLAPHMDKFPNDHTYQSEKAQLLDYIKRVIDKHRHLHN